MRCITWRHAVIASDVIGCCVTQGGRVHNAMDDLASNIRQALRLHSVIGCQFTQETRRDFIMRWTTRRQHPPGPTRNFHSSIFRLDVSTFGSIRWVVEGFQ